MEPIDYDDDNADDDYDDDDFGDDDDNDDIFVFLPMDPKHDQHQGGQ